MNPSINLTSIHSVQFLSNITFILLTVITPLHNHSLRAGVIIHNCHPIGSQLKTGVSKLHLGVIPKTRHLLSAGKQMLSSPQTCLPLGAAAFGNGSKWLFTFFNFQNIGVNLVIICTCTSKVRTTYHHKAIQIA